jgi:hypothetical protein
MVFSIEIRIKAAQQEPHHCLSNLREPCSLFSFEPSMVKTKQFELTLASGAILYREKSGIWNFVSGTVRVSNSKALRLSTKVGTLLLGPGIKWLQWRDDKLWVFSLEGNGEVKLNSTLMQANFVPEGFFNWFSGVEKNGNNNQGVPRRIAPSVAGSVLPGFRKHRDLKLVEKFESRSIAMAAEFYQDVAQQMEDQAVHRQKETEKRELNRIQIEKKARDLFRQKYLGPVDFPEETSESQN